MIDAELSAVLREHKLRLLGKVWRKANLYKADLAGVDLAGVDLAGVDLRGANLSMADLTEADLAGVDLRGADLTEADLTGADLTGADLHKADLSEADLTGADLSMADLTEADLAGVDLRGADLSRTNLSRTNLSVANLTGTCLDGPIPRPTEQEILEAGLEILEGWVYGYRTERSQHCGNTHYTPGVYTAILSRDTTKACHPGIYLASKSWLHANYPDVPIVRCRCRIDHLVHAGDKWRTDELEVLG